MCVCVCVCVCVSQEKSRSVDVLELGVRSSNVSISLSVLCLVVALSDCVISRYYCHTKEPPTIISCYVGGLLVRTPNLLFLSL